MTNSDDETIQMMRNWKHALEAILELLESGRTGKAVGLLMQLKDSIKTE